MILNIKFIKKYINKIISSKNYKYPKIRLGYLVNGYRYNPDIIDYNLFGKTKVSIDSILEDMKSVKYKNIEYVIIDYVLTEKAYQELEKKEPGIEHYKQQTDAVYIAPGIKFEDIW